MPLVTLYRSMPLPIRNRDASGDKVLIIGRGNPCLVKTSEEQWNSMPERDKKLLQFVLIMPWAMIFIVLLIVLIGLLLSN